MDSAVDNEDGASQPFVAVDSAVDNEDGASQSIPAGVEVPAAQLVDNGGDAGVLSGSGQSVDLQDNQLHKLLVTENVSSNVRAVVPSGKDAGCDDGNVQTAVCQSAPEIVSPDVLVVTALSEGDSLANVDLGESPLEEVLSASAPGPAISDSVVSGTPPSSSSPASTPVSSPIVDEGGFVKQLPPRAR